MCFVKYYAKYYTPVYFVQITPLISLSHFYKAQEPAPSVSEREERK